MKSDPENANLKVGKYQNDLHQKAKVTESVTQVIPCILLNFLLIIMWQAKPFRQTT